MEVFAVSDRPVRELRMGRLVRLPAPIFIIDGMEQTWNGMEWTTMIFDFVLIILCYVCQMNNTLLYACSYA